MNYFYNLINDNHILSRIDENLSKRSELLNLTNFGIKEFPEKLFQCLAVRRLYLSKNNICDVSMIVLCLNEQIFKQIFSDFQKALKSNKYRNVAP